MPETANGNKEDTDELMNDYYERQKTKVSFAGRNYFRLMQGSGIIGAPIGWLMNAAELYGIFRPYIVSVTPWFTIIPFTITGLVVIFLIVYGAGYIADHIGVFREQQSFMNNENNPEWRLSWEVVKQNRNDLRKAAAEIKLVRENLTAMKSIMEQQMPKSQEQ